MDLCWVSITCALRSMGLISVVGAHVAMEIPADRVFPKVQGHAGPRERGSARDPRQHRLLHSPVRVAGAGLWLRDC